MIIALKLSQIAMLHASNKETVVLLDDLTAELDLTAQQRLIERLSQLGSRFYDNFRSCIGKNIYMICLFHINYSVLNPVKLVLLHHNF